MLQLPSQALAIRATKGGADRSSPALAINPQQPSRLPRLLPGAWSTLSTAAGKAVVDKVLSALGTSLDVKPLQNADCAVAVHVRKLQCLQGARVVEICQLGGPFSRERAWAFLVDADSTLHLMTGQADWIHAFNASIRGAGGPLSEQKRAAAAEAMSAETSIAAAADYLRFFCGAVWGDEGPFRIVEDLSDTELTGAHGDRDEWQPTIKPIHCRPHPKEEGAFVASASLVYAGCLFRSTFEIFPNGAVSMLSDLHVAANIGRRYDISRSPVRMLADAAEEDHEGR